MGRIRETLANVNSTMNSADVLIALAKAVLLDLKDGAGVVFWPLDGFSKFVNRLVVAVGAYLAAVLMWKIREVLPFTGKSMEQPQLDLTWMEGEPIPFRVAIDLEVDILPHRVSKFVGGPKEYAGREFLVDETKTVIVLKPNHRYVWNGKQFEYKPEA